MIMFRPNFEKQPICYKLFPMVSSTPEQPVDQPLLLVVDDDAGIRDLLSRYLSEQNFRVSAVADGQEIDAWLAKTATRLTAASTSA